MKCPACGRKDCIMRPESHGVCAAQGIPGHDCQGYQLTKQHVPKIGMGGNNPKAKVVAHLDWLIHQAIDSGERYEGLRLSNRIEDGVYLIEDRDSGEVLVRVEL